MRVRELPTIRCLTTSYGHHTIRHRIASDDTYRVPPELGGLSRLRDLALQHNDLSGPIPSELGLLSNLEGLRVEANALTGPIPRELGNLEKLDRLWLSANNLTGPIPPELATHLPV
ncbi:MAG: hypothetical protein F4Z72_11780 [Gemmatimonadales bacterium]|nr:hypothetical protein [Candidatus Palauibacter irciniicola]MYC51568.1 hypothetical protein [Gammaproteobacteria bacterium]